MKTCFTNKFLVKKDNYSNNLLKLFFVFKKMEAKEPQFSKHLKDSRLYITQHSNLEEMLLMTITSTLSGMFGAKTDKKICMNDTLKVLNFSKNILETDIEITTEEPESIKKLKEKSMKLCSDYNIYMRNLYTEGCNFILENHNSLKQLIEKSREDLQSLETVKEKYRGINKQIVDDAYNERILTLMKKFEQDINFIKEKKHTFSVDRSDLTERMKSFQSDIFSLYNNVPMESLVNVKQSYEQDFYEIEKNVCKLFEEYLVKWSESLLF